MSSQQTGFLDDLVSAVRENPVAAALIGGGALWLLAGNEKQKNAANSATAAASTLFDNARNVRTAGGPPHRPVAPPTAPEMDHDEGFNVGESLRDAAGAAADAVSGTADKIKSRFDESSAYARDKIGDFGSSLPGKAALARAQSSLADILESQPLVLGMVGLAIGAAVAVAIRTSDLENEWLGEASDNVKDDLNARAEAVSQSVREASDTLKAELGDTGAEAADRLKQAVADAANAAREKAGY